MTRIESMRKLSAIVLLVLAAGAGHVHAQKAVEKFEIEGLVSPASPKALATSVEEKLPVKVLGFNLYDTPTGWPVMTVELESGDVTREQIEQAVAATEDPTGIHFKVHKGDTKIHLALIEEESKAAQVLGPESPAPTALTNPVSPTQESIGRGKILYVDKCAKCHGLSGNGQGTSAHGFATSPRALSVWHDADKSADGYLFWFITNGRTDMPPWGLVLSEGERWDLVNYIKTLAPVKSP